MTLAVAIAVLVSLVLLAARRIVWLHRVRRAARAHLDYECGHVLRQQARLEGIHNVRAPRGRTPFGAYDGGQRVRSVVLRAGYGGRWLVPPRDLPGLAERALRKAD